ncbi:Hypp4261 [Branchiostoma lanceolatum]|uniref:Hypp4261 protein n=1 Tax=Branchiostoma lanceolatum TaxID=7740 RepID=A0A8K0A619_BRALA|nr:Hypp4261 [Branchiostoma lanceolatum]
MRPRVKAKLAHHRAMLVGEMKPLPMFGSLIENNVLTPAHLEKVLPDDERKELNEQLLDIIPTRGDAAFTVLGEGLEASLQGHLAYLLDPEGREDPDEKKDEEEEDGKEKKTSPKKKKIGQLTRQISRMGSRSSMRPESRDQLTKHKATLVAEMQPLPLFGLLIQNNILSRDMVDGILPPADEKKINERLVDILPDRPDSAYKMFIYALRGNGQGQLVDVLEGDIKPKKYRRESDTGVDKTPAKMSRDSMGAAKSAFESVFGSKESLSGEGKNKYGSKENLLDDGKKKYGSKENLLDAGKNKYGSKENLLDAGKKKYGSKENLLDERKKKPVNPGPGWKSTATPDRTAGSRPSSRPSSTSKERTPSQSSEEGETAAKRKLSEFSATPPRQEMDWKNVERDNEDLRRRRSSIDARKLTMIRTGMKVKQRQLIFANRPAIVDSIQLDSVLDHMVKEGEFTQSQADDLRKMPFRFSRNSRFVDLLLTKGSHNYNAFCDALKDSDQLELARVMEPGRWTGTEYSPAKLPQRKEEPVETTPKKKWKPSSVSDKSPATKRRELQERYGAAESVPDVRLEGLKRKAKERELKEKAIATEKDKKTMKDVGVGKTPPPVRKSQAVPPVEKHIETEETETEKLPTVARSSDLEEIDGHGVTSKPPKSKPKDAKRKPIPERNSFIMKPDSPPPEVDAKTTSPPPKIVKKTPNPTQEVAMKTPSPPPQTSPKLKTGKKQRISSPLPESDMTFSPKTFGVELESSSHVKKPVPLKTLPKTPSPPPVVLLDSPKSPPSSPSAPTVEMVFEDEELEVERPMTVGQVMDDRKRRAEEIRLKMKERKKSLKREHEESNIKIVAESNSSSPVSNGESVKSSERRGSEDTDEGVDVSTPQSPKRIPSTKIEEIGKLFGNVSLAFPAATGPFTFPAVTGPFTIAAATAGPFTFPATGPFAFPAATGPFTIATTTGPFTFPAATGPFAIATATGPFAFPAATGPFIFPAATDPFTIAAASGPFTFPAATGPFAIAAATGPFTIAAATSPFALPAATGPFTIAAASGPFTFPAATGPFAIAAATGPFTIAAATGPFTFPTTQVPAVKIAITTACHSIACQNSLSTTEN